MTSNVIGARTGATLTSAENTTEGKGFRVGDRMTDHNGNVWVYVTASAAITIYDTVQVNPEGGARPVLVANAVKPGFIGHAQVAFAANEAGWVMISGKPVIRVALNCLPNVNLYTSDTAGVLDDVTASTSQAMIAGPVLAVTASGSVTNITAYTPLTYVRRPIVGA